MTTSEVETTTVLDAIKKLTPEIAERAEEIEKAKGIPADLIERIADTGAFRMFVPRRYGGEEMSLPDAMAVIEEVARADASAAWTVMIGADFAPVFGRFPQEILDNEIYVDGPNTMARGAFAPKGVAIPTDGGYIVKGQWPLASGSYEHQWIMGNCILLEGGAPKMTEHGTPVMKLAMLPADQAQYLDNWDSVGLRGTNSTDFILDEVFVPEHHTAEFFGPAGVDTQMFRLPIRLGLGPTHVAVVLGIAQGALDDVSELAKTKRPAFNPMMRLAEDPVFQFRLGQLDTRLAAVRALAEKETRLMWDAAASGEAIDPMASVRQRAMVSLAHTECVAVVNEVFG
ncbi:MAG: acyl-CoA dehydrogenase family protein, partial [Rhodococcus sp. (in: high G+C Gram-positive bacteria)]|uniref:acyl-CoA dehydrogenase family protein n=1 Tax=Rhodococcus sp. TaxID=1831 RepID=UPI003BAF9F2A